MPALSKYDPQTIETALAVMAANRGNTTKSRDDLLTQGIDVPQRTLHDWRTNQHADRYVEMVASLAPKLEQAAAQTALQVSLMAGDLETELLEGLATAHRNGELSAKDIAGALRNVTTTRGISTEKYLLMTGRPTQRTEHKDTDDLIQALKHLNPGLVVDSTAEDIEPAELASATHR